MIKLLPNKYKTTIRKKFIYIIVGNLLRIKQQLMRKLNFKQKAYVFNNHNSRYPPVYVLDWRRKSIIVRRGNL